MLGKILAFLVVAALAVVAIMWFLQGVPPFFSDSFFKSPFAIETDPESGLGLPVYPIPEYQGLELPYASDGETVLSSGGYSDESEDVRSVLLDAEAEYDRLRTAVTDARFFGDPSPYRNQVSITDISPGTGSSPAFEYVRIENESTASNPILITDWSLQSTVTGSVVSIPHGVRTPKSGVISPSEDIYLDPGNTAIIASGVSPVGVSFRENACTGYIGQFQTFIPSLETSMCPQPADLLPATPENIQTYGESCVSFVSRLPACKAYITQFPADLNTACRAFVQGALTYNGCVNERQWRPSFVGDTWRIFLNKNGSLWQPTHDVIRLLDTEGRTVDVWSY